MVTQRIPPQGNFGEKSKKLTNQPWPLRTYDKIQPQTCNTDRIWGKEQRQLQTVLQYRQCEVERISLDDLGPEYCTAWARNFSPNVKQLWNGNRRRCFGYPPSRWLHWSITAG